MKLLVIDNIDSFVYNLVHYFEALNCEVTVVRNTHIESISLSNFDGVVISPGPGLPENAGTLLPFIKKNLHSIPILGICLGLQAIAEVFGAQLTNLKKVYHGESSDISILDNNSSLFKDLPSTIQVGRYHSWAITENTLPNELSITAIDNSGTIMAIEHTFYPIAAVQFHPESILTPLGKKIITNWLNAISTK